MASLPLGAMRAVKGSAESQNPQTAIQGAEDIGGGLIQASSIPSAMDTGGAVDAMSELPSTLATAGKNAVRVTGNAIDRVTGVTSAVRDAQLARDASLGNIEAAKNANFSRYQLEEQKVAEANTAAGTKYQQSLQEAQQAQATAKGANIAKYQGMEQEVAQARAARDAQRLADPEQQAWRDMNTAISAPASSVKIGLGNGDLTSAASLPGRGLVREGLSPAALAKLNPAEQASLVGPLYQKAGKAVNDTIEAATQSGKTLDVGKSAYDVFERIPNPKLQQKAIDAFNETASDIGITNQRAATPQQAVQLRRALQANASFGPTGDLASIKGIGTQLYRAVTGDLHAAVPELVPVDQHYGDLKEAVKAVQKNVQKFGANLPPRASGEIEDLTVAPYKPLPALPEAPAPKQLTASPYQPLPPTPAPVNTGQIRSTQLKGVARNAAITTAVGGGGIAAGRGLIKDLLGN